MRTMLLIGTFFFSLTLGAGGTNAAQISPEREIPAGAVKGTPENDDHPPRLHVEEWNKPVPLPAAINTAGAEDSPYVTADGNTLYFWFTPDVKVPPHKQLIDGATGIYAIQKQAGRWGKAKRIILQEPGEVSLEGAPVVQGNTIWFCSVLRHAIQLCAWCHVMLRTESGQALLYDDMAAVGQHLDADLFGYFEQLEELPGSSMVDSLRWLCVDRAIARHFQVAARKLVQHDTFRLIEDEEGVRATDKCPIADVAIRIDSMLSLITDVKLLARTDDGYTIVPETRTAYDEQIERIESSRN